MNRATHPSDPHLQAKSVIGRCSIPGRVFVEVHDETNARSFAMSIAELNPNAVRIVPVEEMLSVLYIKNPDGLQQDTQRDSVEAINALNRLQHNAA